MLKQKIWDSLPLVIKWFLLKLSTCAKHQTFQVCWSRKYVIPCHQLYHNCWRTQLKPCMCAKHQTIAAYVEPASHHVSFTPALQAQGFLKATPFLHSNVLHSNKALAWSMQVRGMWKLEANVTAFTTQAWNRKQQQGTKWSLCFSLPEAGDTKASSNKLTKAFSLKSIHLID